MIWTTHLIGREETFVARAPLARPIILIRLMHTVAKIPVAVLIFAALIQLGYRFRAAAVSHQLRARVLQDELAVGILAATRMLIGPLDLQHAAGKVAQVAHIVAAPVVVLRVE